MKGTQFGERDGVKRRLIPVIWLCALVLTGCRGSTPTPASPLPAAWKETPDGNLTGVGPVLAVSADDKWLAVNVSNQEAIRVYTAADRKQKFEFRGFKGWLAYLAFTPDGRYLISGHSPY